jgi:hypothetical protein
VTVWIARVVHKSGNGALSVPVNNFMLVVIKKVVIRRVIVEIMHTIETCLRINDFTFVFDDKRATINFGRG